MTPDMPENTSYSSVTAAVVGSRTFCDYDGMKAYMAEICASEGYQIGKVVSGGAAGADLLGKMLAAEYGLQYEEFSPDWAKYGRSAGFVRNLDIIKACDVCFAFWDGESKGTAHDIKVCGEMGRPCHIYRF